MAVLGRSGFQLIFTRVLGNVVVQVHGELDHHAAPELRDRLTDVIELQGNLSVVLDLSGMTFIDSTGLEVFVGALKQVRAMGGDLTLSAPSPATYRLLEICGLVDAFTITRT